MIDFGINYKNTITGEKFEDLTLVCNVLSGVEDSTKEILISKYRILYNKYYNKEIFSDIPDIDPDTMEIVNPDFIKERIKIICKGLKKFYKQEVIKELSNDISSYIVKKYLEKTPIGGKEKRKFDIEPVIDFTKKYYNLMYVYIMNSKIVFLENGNIGTKSEKDIDSLGKNILDSWTKDFVLSKMDIEEKKEIQRNLDKKLNDELIVVLDKQLSKNGNVCLLGCKIRGSVCGCPVQKKGWFGNYEEIEECNKKECEKGK